MQPLCVTYGSWREPDWWATSPVRRLLRRIAMSCSLLMLRHFCGHNATY